MSYSVYILRCADGTLYTGFAKELSKRLAQHDHGPKGAKYTRARRPLELVYSEEAGTLSIALKREAAIKRLSRSEKLKLITRAV